MQYPLGFVEMAKQTIHLRFWLIWCLMVDDRPILFIPIEYLAYKHHLKDARIAKQSQDVLNFSLTTSSTMKLYNWIEIFTLFESR
jgi:hypothetical protein